MIHKRVLASSVLVLALYLVWAFASDGEEVMTSLAKIGWLGVTAALVLSLVNYGLRFLRWHWYLRVLNQRVTLAKSCRFYIAGFALTATPGKAGEAIRSLMLSKHGVPYSKSLAALLAERVTDVLAVLAIGGAGIVAFPDYAWVAIAVLVSVFATLIVIGSPGLRTRLFGWVAGSRNQRIRSSAQHVLDLLTHAADLLRRGRLVNAWAIGIIAWGAEAIAFAFIVDWLGYDLSVPLLASIYALSMLAGAVSFLPGGVGGAEAAMAVMLFGVGLDAPDVVSATLVCRLTTLWFAVVLGIVALVASNAQPAAVELKSEPGI